MHQQGSTVSGRWTSKRNNGSVSSIVFKRTGSGPTINCIMRAITNMWVTYLRTSVLSIITGGGKWVEITIPMDPLYLSVLVSAEKKFWRCVQSGETPASSMSTAAPAH